MRKRTKAELDLRGKWVTINARDAIAVVDHRFFVAYVYIAGAWFLLRGARRDAGIVNVQIVIQDAMAIRSLTGLADGPAKLSMIRANVNAAFAKGRSL